MNEREAALFAAIGDEDNQRHAFVEYLNFLEIYSAALNSGLMIGVAQEIVSDKVLDSIVAVESHSHWHDEIERSITSGTTYRHIGLFMKRQRGTLVARRYVANRAGTYNNDKSHRAD